MKIIYGGSFNPPTIAHKEAYFFLDKKLNFDEFLYMPVSKKYSKSGLIDNEYRIEMLNLMIEDMKKAAVSTYECDNVEYKGTYNLLKDEPEDTYFLIGSDNLRDLYKWINSKLLISTRKFIVISRDGSDDLTYIKSNDYLKDYIDNFIVFNDFNIKASSSNFRLNKDYSLLPKEVAKYIKNNNLYVED